MTAASAAPGPLNRPHFDVDVAASGYRWWYVDGISADAQNSIVIIAFIGSVFSPYYFRARQQGAADPFDFCSINIGLYRRRGKRWAMTERGRETVDRGADWFRVGPSSVSWRDDRLEIELDERSMPFLRPIRGRVVLRPDYLVERSFELDAAGLHRWQPYAPAAHIEVRLDEPALSWEGAGYFDSNGGQRALEEDFLNWDWSRGKSADGTDISYAVRTIDGGERKLALEFGPDGTPNEVVVPGATRLPASGWRVTRAANTAIAPTVARTLEDTPFYARSLLQVGYGADSRLVMHESLDLARFKSGWVRFLLPFRMPRLARR